MCPMLLVGMFKSKENLFVPRGITDDDDLVCGRHGGPGFEKHPSVWGLNALPVSVWVFAEFLPPS